MPSLLRRTALIKKWIDPILHSSYIIPPPHHNMSNTDISQHSQFSETPVTCFTPQQCITSRQMGQRQRPLQGKQICLARNNCPHGLLVTTNDNLSCKIIILQTEKNWVCTCNVCTFTPKKKTIWSCLTCGSVSIPNQKGCFIVLTYFNSHINLVKGVGCFGFG